MVTRKALLESIREVLLAALPEVNIYADEVREGFKTPSFFVRLLMTKNTVNMSINEIKLSIILTYYPHSRSNKEFEFAAVMDSLDKEFGLDLNVGERTLHIEKIEHDRIGEKSDIMQSVVTISYYDETGYTPDVGETAGHVQIRVVEEEMGGL